MTNVLRIAVGITGVCVPELRQLLVGIAGITDGSVGDSLKKSATLMSLQKVFIYFSRYSSEFLLIYLY